MVANFVDAKRLRAIVKRGWREKSVYSSFSFLFFSFLFFSFLFFSFLFSSQHYFFTSGSSQPQFK